MKDTSALIKELEKRKTKMINLRNERIKVEGMHEQVLNQLKEEGINTLEEGKLRVQAIEEQNLQVVAEAEALLKEFDEKYKLFF